MTHFSVTKNRILDYKKAENLFTLDKKKNSKKL